MKRTPSRELLDENAGTPAEITDSLADIDSINHRLGGVATTARMIAEVARASGHSDFSLLDVAAGSGEVPRSARKLLQPSNIRLRVTLLDRSPDHMLGRDSRVAGDALALPFRDASFDLISCCLFVHHLSPDEVALFVKEALRCSRVAVLINDLVRGRVHLAAAHAGRLIFRSRLSQNDAPASVRQAYTPQELHKLLERTGAAAIEITRHYFYRMGAIVWKQPTPGTQRTRDDV